MGKRSKRSKPVEKSWDVGVPVSVTATPGPAAPQPSMGGPQTGVVQTSPPSNPGMYWPSPQNYFAQCKDATRKAIVEYATIAADLNNEQDTTRRTDLTAKANNAIQNAIQGIAIGTEAAELQNQRVRTGDQSATYEIKLTEDCLKRLLKLVWIHNTVAQKGSFPGLEMKLLESQLVGRINRVTTLFSNVDGIPLEIDKGEDPTTLWSMEYTPPPPPQAITPTPPSMPGPETQASEGEQTEIPNDQSVELPEPGHEGEVGVEAETPEGVEETPEGEGDMLEKEQELLQREEKIAAREKAVAEREEALAAKENQNEEVTEETPEVEEPVEEAPEEEVTEETPEDEGVEEEVPEEETTEEELGEEEEDTDEEDLTHCIECDQMVTPEEIATCENPRCPLKAALEQKESGEELVEKETDPKAIKHVVMVDIEDHSEHNVKTLIYKEYTGVQADFCIDCQKLLNYEFDPQSWDNEQAKAWVAKQARVDVIKTKSPEDLVVGALEQLDYIDDNFILEVVQAKRYADLLNEDNGKGFPKESLNIPVEDIEAIIGKAFKACL